MSSHDRFKCGRVRTRVPTKEKSLRLPWPTAFFLTSLAKFPILHSKAEGATFCSRGKPCQSGGFMSRLTILGLLFLFLFSALHGQCDPLTLANNDIIIIKSVRTGKLIQMDNISGRCLTNGTEVNELTKFRVEGVNGKFFQLRSLSPQNSIIGTS